MALIGLLDIDSTIPNLALMKLARHHRNLGDQVEMYAPLFKNEYDKVYASKVFGFSDGSLLDPDLMVIGGTGTDSTLDLPAEVEDLQPDYSLYGFPHSIGFTMRGCRLKCGFCVVPQKEGRARENSTIEQIWQQHDSDFIVLLDNDFFGNPAWSARVDELIKFNLRVNFNQGLNIRNLKPHQAEALAAVRFRNYRDTMHQVHFAWDDPRHESLIHKGIAVCAAAGIKPGQMAFYILIGYHSTPAQDLHRVMVLKDYGCDPFVMPYYKADPYQRKFARWVNHKAIFNTVPWTDYEDSLMKKPQDANQIPMWAVQ